MNPGSVDLPLAYRLAVGASTVLGASWLAYLVYLHTTVVTQQSVYMGSITFYAGVLMAVSGLATVVIIGGIAVLARTHQPIARRAALWGLGALLVAALVFIITRPLIDRAV
jgi:hypothetical protein